MIFFGSALAHLEPKLELFEVWEVGSWCHWQWWWSVARLSPIYLLFACKIFLLPVPTRPGTRTFLQVPDPSRPEVKNPYPSDPGHDACQFFNKPCWSSEDYHSYFVCVFVLVMICKTPTPWQWCLFLCLSLTLSHFVSLSLSLSCWWSAEQARGLASSQRQHSP